MGIKFEYICSKCGYTAEVSGGRDVGFVAVIRTMICDKCRELVEVTIGWFGRHGPSGDPENDKDLGRCPVCNGTDVRPWPRHRPCPKCGGRMKRDKDSFIMWDYAIRRSGGMGWASAMGLPIPICPLSIVETEAMSIPRTFNHWGSPRCSRHGFKGFVA